MITFFKKGAKTIYAVDADHALSPTEVKKLEWLLGGQRVNDDTLRGTFIGPRREMITPWSTNAVEITQNMAMTGIARIEEFTSTREKEPRYDKMLQRVYHVLDGDIFKVTKTPDPIVYIDDIERYNEQEGLALSPEEVDYLKGLAQRLGRPLTDSEVFGFSQVNSEHCRHKIFGGTFIIDGKEMPVSLFGLIKKTTREHPNRVISAYKDNVAFLEGPSIEQFAPAHPDRPDYFQVKDIDAVISLKAETHNWHSCVHDQLSAHRGTAPVGAVHHASTPLAVPDTRANTHQGLQRRQRLRQQVWPAAGVRLAAHL